jgi:hypothetical protein
LDLEAHDGFIDGADLLDIEGAVGEALAGEVEEEFEDAVEGAVRNPRERGFGMLNGIAAFEEGEAIGVKEVALAGRKGHFPVLAAGVDGTEKSEELGPSGEALVHGVRIAFVIGPQALEEPLDGIVPLVEIARGHETAVFCIEEEDNAQQSGNEAAVDFLRITLPGFCEEFAA